MLLLLLLFYGFKIHYHKIRIQFVCFYIMSFQPVLMVLGMQIHIFVANQKTVFPFHWGWGCKVLITPTIWYMLPWRWADDNFFHRQTRPEKWMERLDRVAYPSRHFDTIWKLERIPQYFIQNLRILKRGKYVHPSFYPQTQTTGDESPNEEQLHCNYYNYISIITITLQLL